MKRILYLSLTIFVLVLGATACIEDGFSTSPSDQPTFSVETLDLGDVFTAEPTPTSRFVVYNRHSKALSISDISLSGDNADCFRINVDGISGERFSGVEIRPNDSIFVFVEATLPETAEARTDFSAQIDFTTNGVVRSVPVAAGGVNVVRLRGKVYDHSTRLTADRPYQIYDSLVVAEGRTLTIMPGTTLHFHDKAMLIVRGSLVCRGTADEPVVMCGDRTGNVVADISFDIMSRQWQGVFFTATSRANRLTNTVIKNTIQGVMATGSGSEYAEPQVRLTNCRLTNSGDLVLEAYHSNIMAVGCEFSEASGGLVYLQGGDYTFNHCTFANNYLFTAYGYPAVQLAHVSADADTGLDDGSELPYLRADFSNSIIYGMGGDVSHGDLSGTDVYFRRCLLKSEGTDDDNFIDCIWAEDPLFYTVRNDYVFDYRLKPESPAIAAAYVGLTLDAAATDAYGNARGAAPDLGAYVFTEPQE